MAIILITGSSSGFGMLAAARLAAAGHTVYATMRDLKKKEDLLEEVGRRGAKVRLLELDVTKDPTIAAAVKQVEADEGRLHVLVNNAGYGIGGFFEDLQEAEIRAQFETNLFGVQKVTRHCLPLLRKTAAESEKNGSVKIINISSGQGRSALPGLGAYSASKFALEGFSESLHIELLSFGVQVVLLEPGGYRTKIFTDNSRQAAGAGDPNSPYTPLSKALDRRIAALVASEKGIGDPEDVAKMIEKVVNQAKPRLRYRVGSGGTLRMLAIALLPFRWYAALVHRMIFGQREPTPHT